MPDAAPVRQSLVQWFLVSLGFRYAILLLLAALLSFVLALIIVIRGKGPFAGVSLLLVVHVPLLIGVYAAVDGLIRSYTVIAASDVTVKASEVASGYSTALAASLAALALMVPGYATAVLGSFIRAVSGSSKQNESL